jgi:hypothetical protein
MKTETRRRGKNSPALVIPVSEDQEAGGPKLIDLAPTSSNGHHPPPQCSAEIEVERLPIGVMRSAGEQYQRPVDWKRVDRMVERFRMQSLNTLLINQRPDGQYWIVDGQHRVEVLRKLYGDSFEWWCFLIHVEGPAQEAAIFVEVNADHARPSPGVLFQGRLIRGEGAALEIEKIVIGEEMSLHLSSGREGANELPTSVLDDIYKKWGADRLRQVLKFSRETWSGQKGFSSSAVVSGVATFFHHYGDHKAFDPGKISEVLKEFQVQYVYREAKIVAGREFSHRHVAFATAMQQLYNSHCGSPASRLTRKKEKPPKKK